MTLRNKYLLFVTVIHAITLVLSFVAFRDNKIWFIVSEVFVIISLVISWQLYKNLIQPLKLIMDGITAIRERDFNVRFVPTGKSEMDQLIGVYNEMIDQLRLERTQQKEQHFFLEKIVNTSPTGILILDFDERVEAINPRALKLLEMDERAVLKKAVQEIEHPVFRGIRTLAAGQSASISINGMETYKCQKSSFMHQGFARHFIMIEELSREILLAEKNAYGKVIRMMAHEVNNTIGPVNSIVSSAIGWQERQAERGNPDLMHALQVAIDRNVNLNSFMRNLADVVKIPAPNRHPADINETVRSIATLFGGKAAEAQIAVRLQLTEQPLRVHIDTQQMEQVLINIFKNAIEAIGTRGEVHVITQNSPPALAVRDTGKGFTPEVEARLFTPFFSTRKDGQGIGLTLIREVLYNHGFDFRLKREGRYTEFWIGLQPAYLRSN